jgi:hypothetical protein
MCSHDLSPSRSSKSGIFKHLGTFFSPQCSFLASVALFSCTPGSHPFAFISGYYRSPIASCLVLPSDDVYSKLMMIRSFLVLPLLPFHLPCPCRFETGDKSSRLLARIPHLPPLDPKHNYLVNDLIRCGHKNLCTDRSD